MNLDSFAYNVVRKYLIIICYKKMIVPPRHLRIFISSPGDVNDERALAFKVIERLPYDPLLRGQVTLEVIAWDKPGAGAPILATMTPQEAINQGLPLPADSDIAVFILWSRFGTPLPDNNTKPDGSQFLSGTEWEFENAVAGNSATGLPKVLVYRRTERVALYPEDADYDEKYEQWQRVQRFFESFKNPDGSIRRGLNTYETPHEFEEMFALHLRSLIGQMQTAIQENEKAEVSAKATTKIWSGSPFPGLRAYGIKDAPIFFGRGRETDGLIARLSDDQNRFLAVVSASGAGKSSIVAAGLIPRLMSNAIPGSKDWLFVRFTPDELGAGNPYASLAAALIRDPLNIKAKNVAQNFKDDAGAFKEICEEALQEHPDWVQLLVFVDQFEEIFTRATKEDRQGFIDLLTRTTNSQRIRLIVTLRADFYAHCIEYELLAELLEKGTFPLAPPSHYALSEMITRPAELAGLVFESDLPVRILDDIGDDPGSLALMAYALHELYLTGKKQRLLTHQAYDQFGGVKGSIGARAKEVFDVLDVEAREALPAVFRELVEVNESGAVTRRRTPLKIIQDEADSPASRLLEALTEARLLVQSKNERGQPIVEVAHEALFQSWPLLAQWIDETKDDLRLLSQVRQAARVWRENECSNNFRWPDHRLYQVHTMIHRLQPNLDKWEGDFVRTRTQRYLDEIADKKTEHKRRAYIGRQLDIFGDSRHGVSLLENGLPDIAWIMVEGGELHKNTSGEKIHIPPFLISKYPITFLQYRAFIESENGYYESSWWESLDVTTQEPAEQTFQYGNHPADNVSWFEAVAYCRWMTAHLKDIEELLLTIHEEHQTLIPSNFLNLWEIRLPTEWEWEFVATLGNNDLNFPWGESWDDNLANTSESKLNQSTAVGLYPQGASPIGVLDMSGNVWEWCLNQFKPEFNRSRALRGGSWSGNHDYARANCRGWDLPWSRNAYRGFRIVLAEPKTESELELLRVPAENVDFPSLKNGEPYDITLTWEQDQTDIELPAPPPPPLS